MSIFGRKANRGPVVELRQHIDAFMYLVKQGESKFGNKTEIGEIFRDMESTRFLFRQAIAGTMYDFRGKLDYTLWDAAVHKYGEDMEHLKKALLKCVDEAALKEEDEEEEKKKAEEEKKEEELQKAEETTDWAATIKEEVKASSEQKKIEKAERREAAKRRLEDRSMSKEDCRELWHIMQGMDREFKEMNQIADDFFAVYGKKNGCLGGFLLMLLIPAGAAYGLWTIL
jgi:hypothetical protein